MDVKLLKKRKEKGTEKQLAGHELLYLVKDISL